VNYGTSPASKPAGTWSWSGYLNNGSWYTRSASAPYVYTLFTFGTTTVTADITLYLTWTLSAGIEYTLAANGTSFNATKAVYGSTSTYNGTIYLATAAPFQNAFTAIRNDANRLACSITFSGTPLNIVSESMSFDGGLWGEVTLRGNVTSSVSTTDGAVVVMSAGMRIISHASIANTNTGSTVSAIRNNGTGLLTIQAGTVSASGGHAIRNNSTGNVEIRGGTVSATGASTYALYNASTGYLNVIDGTVTSSGNYTVYIAASGTATGYRL
jgi:hypothetical protein